VKHSGEHMACETYHNLHLFPHISLGRTLLARPPIPIITPPQSLHGYNKYIIRRTGNAPFQRSVRTSL
jgi:hypothetical protein